MSLLNWFQTLNLAMKLLTWNRCFVFKSKFKFPSRISCFKSQNGCFNVNDNVSKFKIRLSISQQGLQKDLCFQLNILFTEFLLFLSDVSNFTFNVVTDLLLRKKSRFIAVDYIEILIAYIIS